MAEMPTDPIQVPLKLHGVQIFGSAEELAWTGGMEIDADGSPRAYHPDDWGEHPAGYLHRGLDAPESAVGEYHRLPHSDAVMKAAGLVAGRDTAGHYVSVNVRQVKTWVGVVTDHDGTPIVQGPHDPAPGYWVSKTSYVYPDAGDRDPRRYVDAEHVPYVVVPPDLEELGVKIGDLALVAKGGRSVWALVADTGPRGHIGEASIATAVSLGLSHDPRGSGGDDREGGITYRVFLGSGARLREQGIHPRTKDEIAQAAMGLGLAT